MSNFVRVQLQPKTNPADAALAADREAIGRQQLTREESSILFESLPEERKDEIARQALAHSSGATRTLLQPDGSTQTENLGIVRGSSAAPKQGVEGILATARSLGGRSMGAWSEVDDRTTFTIDGITMTAATAARMGWISKNGDGGYGPGGAAPAAKEVQPEESPVEDFHSPEMRECLGNLTEMAGSPEAANAVVGSVIARAIDSDFESAASVLTHRFGHDPADAQRDVVAAINDGYNRAAEHLTRNYGVDGTAALQWVGDALPKAERSSLAYRVFRGDKTAFQEIAARYKKAATMAEINQRER